MKVGIIQHTCSADRAANTAKLRQYILSCAQQGAELVVLPELHNDPYFCQTEDAEAFRLAEPIPGPSTTLFGELARSCGIVLILSLFEKRAPGLYHNTAAVIDRDGTPAGIYRKMHIPDDPAYYEKFYFTPGDLGFQPVHTSLGNLGVLICWDQWYPEAARLIAMHGADILIYPTAIGWETTDSPEEQQRQQDAWLTIQRSHAIANGLPLLSVNRTGHEPDPSGHTGGIHFWGSSFAAGPQGEILTRLPSDHEAIQVIDVDTTRTEHVRRWWPFFRDRRIDAYQEITRRYL
jgi:N-carbamoylputrescine amidase